MIAIENQFGMKYFSGAWEDHTGILFDGILGYKNKQGIRTFGKMELDEILKRSGFKYTKYYYPLPDYKLPNIIFSDEYVPTKERLKEYRPYLSEKNSFALYDEKEAYLDIIKNKQFSFFANSFIIEASLKKFESKVDLSRQNLIKIDKIMEQFYNSHYKIKDFNNNTETDLEKNLLEENKKLRYEINAILNSKSWKITRPLRNIRRKNK